MFTEHLYPLTEGFYPLSEASRDHEIVAQRHELEIKKGASNYFSAITSISKSFVVSLSSLEKAPSFAP